MKVHRFSIFGDSKLVVRQVRKFYQTKHPILKYYINDTWGYIQNYFKAFNIEAIPREDNMQAHSLEVSASTFKVPESFQLQYQIEVRYKPSILDNLKHWKVFEDDEQSKICIQAIEEFSCLHIDEEYNETTIGSIVYSKTSFKQKITNHDIIQLSKNHVPKGLVHLEILFDQNDVIKPSMLNSQQVDVQDCNIGTKEEVRNIEFSTTLPQEIKDKYVKLFKEYKGMFSWIYEDLNTYDTFIIVNKIPLKP